MIFSFIDKVYHGFYGFTTIFFEKKRVLPARPHLLRQAKKSVLPAGLPRNRGCDTLKDKEGAL